MKLIILALCASLLAGCASAPAPLGTSIPAARLDAAIVPGQTTRAQMLGALGPTKFVHFDSGYEVWLYQSPADGGRFAEFVVLVDPAGVVSKTRRRAPSSP
ncbi:hypothetical protein [Massilia sp. S19_KUP03_FR1]|uniref:hypothetical protein n=1 Tax=Massilia sp. S19_KUP03_FR1 TaxID=3025503 RepID=UPI002FCDAA9A